MGSLICNYAPAKMKRPERAVERSPGLTTTSPVSEVNVMADSQPNCADGATPLNYRHLQTRDKNPNWRGGRSIASNGYVLIRVGVGHHLADVRGYAYEHRLVAEEKLGRRLLLNEIVHHKDENKQNNHPDNLEVVVGNAEHFLRHRKPGSNRRRPTEVNPLVLCECGCGETFTRFDSTGRPRKYVTGHNPRASSFQGDLLLYLEIVPESGRPDFIASFFGVERRQVTEAMSKLKKKGLVEKHNGEWSLNNV